MKKEINNKHIEIKLDSKLGDIAKLLNGSAVSFEISDEIINGVFFLGEYLFFASDNNRYDGGWEKQAKAARKKYAWALSANMKEPLIEVFEYLNASSCTVTLKNGDFYVINIIDKICLFEPFNKEVSNYSIF